MFCDMQLPIVCGFVNTRVLTNLSSTFAVILWHGMEQQITCIKNQYLLKWFFWLYMRLLKSHPPYLAGLLPADSLFPKLKVALKGLQISYTFRLLWHRSCKLYQWKCFQWFIHILSEVHIVWRRLFLKNCKQFPSHAYSM